jgi:hypothetical protein
MKPAWTNSPRDPIWKNPSQKRASGEAQGEGPEFKHHYHTKKCTEWKKNFQIRYLTRD